MAIDNLNDNKRVVFVDGLRSDEAAELSKEYNFGVFFTDNGGGTGDIYKGGVNYTPFKGIKSNTIKFANGHKIGLTFDPTTGLISLANKYILKNITISSIQACKQDDNGVWVLDDSQHDVSFSSNMNVTSPSNVVAIKFAFEWEENETNTGDYGRADNVEEDTADNSKALKFSYDREIIRQLQHVGSDKDGIYMFKLCKRGSISLVAQSLYDSNGDDYTFKLNITPISNNIEFVENVYTWTQYHPGEVQIKVSPITGDISPVDISFKHEDVTLASYSSLLPDENGVITIEHTFDEEYVGIDVVATMSGLGEEHEAHTHLNVEKFHRYAESLTILDANKVELAPGKEISVGEPFQFYVKYHTVDNGDEIHNYCTEPVYIRTINVDNYLVSFNCDITGDGSIATNETNIVGPFTVTPNEGGEFILLANSVNSEYELITDGVNIIARIKVENFSLDSEYKITYGNDGWIVLYDVNPTNTTDTPTLDFGSTTNDLIITTGEIVRSNDKIFIGVHGLEEGTIRNVNVIFGDLEKTTNINVVAQEIYADGVTIDAIYESDGMTLPIEFCCYKKYIIKGTVSPSDCNMPYQEHGTIPYLCSRISASGESGNPYFDFYDITRDGQDYEAAMVCKRQGDYTIYSIVNAGNGISTDATRDLTFINKGYNITELKMINSEGITIVDNDPDWSIDFGYKNAKKIGIQFIANILGNEMVVEDLIDRTITWSCENTAVKFLDAAGNSLSDGVSSDGDCMIYFDDIMDSMQTVSVTATANNGISVTRLMNLKDPRLTKISLPEYINIFITETDDVNVMAHIAPLLDAEEYNQTVMWSIYNKSTHQFELNNVQLITTENENECAIRITNKKEGSFILMAASPLDPEVYATCIVNIVYNNEGSVTHGWFVDGDDLKLYTSENDTYKIADTSIDTYIYPKYYNDLGKELTANITLTSSDPSVCTVDRFGHLIPIKVGKAKIYANKNNVEPVWVEVVKGITDFKFKPEVYQLANIGIWNDESFNLGELVIPTVGSSEKPLFESSDPAIAYVDDDGIIRTNIGNYGEVTITVSNQNKDVKKSVTFTVYNAPNTEDTIGNFVVDTSKFLNGLVLNHTYESEPAYVSPKLSQGIYGKITSTGCDPMTFGDVHNEDDRIVHISSDSVTAAYTIKFKIDTPQASGTEYTPSISVTFYWGTDTSLLNVIKPHYEQKVELEPVTFTFKIQ